MSTKNLKTIEELGAFLQRNQPVAFVVLGKKTERYNLIRKTLIKFRYMSLSKKQIIKSWNTHIIRTILQQLQQSTDSIYKLTHSK